MLYNLNFLQQGAIFPPAEEIKRLEAYRVNAMLARDEAWSALPEYKKRVMYLLSRFALAEENVYFFTANYWSDLVSKTQELLYGDFPEFTNDKSDPLFDEIFNETDFSEKVVEGLEDFVSLGDWVTKAIETENGTSFINIAPSTWFPVVSIENVKEVKYHVLAWVVPISKKYSELHVQIHEKGKCTNKAFMLEDYNKDSYFIDSVTCQKVYYETYKIGVELLESKTDFKLGAWKTGLNDFAVIHSANNANARSIFGTSDFDLITDSVMEYNVRRTLNSVVLDKHSAPIMSGPPISGDLSQGNYIEVHEGDTAPSYLTWDANMQACKDAIDGYKEDIANLSGMGSLLSSKTFGESQGYDALMIKLAPALMRAARKRTLVSAHLKKLLSSLASKRGISIAPSEILINWHDSIPTTESVRADIAQKHLATGWSMKRVLMQDYGLTEEEADAEIEQKRIEAPQMPIFGGLDENTDNEPTDEENADKGGDNA